MRISDWSSDVCSSDLGPLVIAACTEFTSLILTRHMEERRRGLDPQAAADMASARTGRAFATSALTTIVGVGVLATSPLPLLREIGRASGRESVCQFG